MSDIVERLQSAGSGYTSGISSRSDSKPASRTGSNLRQTCDEASECHSHGMECPEREQVASGDQFPYVTGRTTRYCTLTTFALTDEEREAIKVCESYYSDNDMDAACWKIAATLRGLLERLGGER